MTTEPHSLSKYLSQLSSQPHHVLDSSIPTSSYVALDLSANNKALQQINVANSEALHTYIFDFIDHHNAKVAYGGYLEHRTIYQRSTHFNKQEAATERNIHLGLDLWAEVGTPIFAPLEGVVHSFANNTNFGDYGPTIILKHQMDDQVFHTLYGHLSSDALQDLKTGTKIAKGQQFATLGNAKENGDYPPHLHFQIIKDVRDYVGDYPGVCSKRDLDVFKANCPDPKLLLQLP